MNNIKKIYNLFQTVCLKYKDTVVSLKLTNYKTLFKDNYPEVYDKILSLFEIIANNDNINIIEDKISDLKNKLQEILSEWRDSGNSFPTDELELLITYLNDYLTDTNKFDNTEYINIYTHLLTDDLTPLTETDKERLLEIIINNYKADTGYNPNSSEPSQKEDLLKYNPEVNSQFYHFLYNKDYPNNINFDPIYCDRHYKLKQNEETLVLKNINYNNTQMSRGNLKKLISDKLEFNETGDLYTDKIRHIIGDVYDNKSLDEEIAKIKNKKEYLNKNNKFDINLLLNKSLEQIYQIYLRLPNGSDITFNTIKKDLFNSTVFDKYQAFLLYDREIDDKYFNGRISYFNNFIKHMCNFSNIMSSDPVITKYDLSLLYMHVYYNENGQEVSDHLINYLYMEIEYMLKQYNEWYKGIKKSIGFETEEYNKSQDTLRQLAEKNNDLKQFNKYMDINYNRILEVNKDLPLFEKYNCIKVIGKILNKWKELILQSYSTYLNDAEKIMYLINQGDSSFENNDLSEKFKNQFMKILNDQDTYKIITKLLDLIMPTYIKDYFDKENINLYQKNIPFYHSHTGCVECYKNYIQFSLTRFYKCMRDINLFILYNGRIEDEIFEYKNDELVLLKDISYLAPYDKNYGYTIINYNNKYCRWKLAVDSIGIIENPQLELIKINENNKDTEYTLNMLANDTLIKAGSILVDTDYLNNMKVINFKKIDDKNKYAHKLLYWVSHIDVYGGYINNDDYVFVGINYTEYDPVSEKFIPKLIEDNLGSKLSEGETIRHSYPIKYKYTNKKCHSIGHYKISKNKHYMYPLTSDNILPNPSENDGDGNKLISKYGIGYYIYYYKPKDTSNKKYIVNICNIEKSTGHNYYINNSRVCIDYSSASAIFTEKFPLTDYNGYVVTNISSFKYIDSTGEEITVYGEKLDNDLEVYNWYPKLYTVTPETITDNIFPDKIYDDQITEEDIDRKSDIINYQPFNKRLMVKDFNNLMLRKAYPNKFKNTLIVDKEVIDSINCDKYSTTRLNIENALCEYTRYPKYLEHYFMTSRIDYKLNGLFTIRCLINPTLLPRIITDNINSGEWDHIKYEIQIQGKDMIIKDGKIMSSNGPLYMVGIETANDHIFTTYPIPVKLQNYLEVIDFQQFNNLYDWIDLYFDDAKFDNMQILELNHSTYGVLKNMKFINHF